MQKEPVENDAGARAGETRFHSKAPIVNALICCVLTLALIGLSGLWFWVGSYEGAAIGPGIANLVLAAVSVAVAVHAFGLGRRGPDDGGRRKRLRALTLSAVSVGALGAGAGVIAGAMTGTYASIGAGVLVFVMGGTVALQAALVYGSEQPIST